MNFMYIKDFIEILAEVRYRSEMENNTYISNDSPITLVELVHLIQGYLNLPLTRFHIPLLIGKGAGVMGSLLSNIFGVTMPLTKNRIAAMTRNVCYSAEKLRKDMSFQLPFGIQAGLFNTIKWYQQQNLI